MEFKILTRETQLDEIEKNPFNKTQVIFKHSTRCSISAMAKRVLTSEMKGLTDEKADIYYLDLLNYRSISNEIAQRYGIEHESPQIIVLKEGKVIHYASHGKVSLRNVDL